MNHQENRAPRLDDRHTARIVDVAERDVLDHWCRVFQVTPAELADAVLAVGRNPDLVRRYCQVKLLRRA